MKEREYRMWREGMCRIAVPFRAALLLCALFLCVFALSASFADGKRASITNEYIGVSVDKESGRFVIRTTGGSPASDSDSNIALLFDSSPPTSYAYLAFDGGKDVRRFGDKAGSFLQEPYVTDNNNAIMAVWRYRDVEVTQSCTMLKSAESGLVDSVNIVYNVRNASPRQESIGIRIVLDTALSDLDGSSYRVPGFGLVANEREFSGGEVPLSWYSFDDYTRPNVRTVGVLRGEGLIPPDRLVFAAYRRIFAGDWNFKAKRGESFRLSSFGNKDSAVALIYECRPVNPAGTFTVATAYGLYGVQEQVIANNWAVTLRSADVIDNVLPFEFTAEVQNISEGRLTNCAIKLELPASLTIVHGKDKKQQANAVYIRELRSKQITNMRWDLRAVESSLGDCDIRVYVDGTDGVGGRTYNAVASKALLVTRPDERRDLGAEFFNSIALQAGAPDVKIPSFTTTNYVFGPTRVIQEIPLIDPRPAATNLHVTRDLPPINVFLKDGGAPGIPVPDSGDAARRALSARLAEASLRARTLEEKMVVSEYRRIESMIERAVLDLRNPQAKLPEISADILALEDFLSGIARRK